MTIFYFSTTGNSLYVAKRIGGELVSIPQAMREKGFYYKDDKIGFVFPTHAYSLPEIVKQFINKTTFEADYFFSIVTHGGSSGGTLDKLQSMLEKQRIKFNYLKDIRMVGNYLPLSDIEEELLKEPSFNIEENIDKIISDIENNESNIKTKKVSSVIFSNVVSNAFSSIYRGNVDDKFSVTDKCNGCRTCENVCYVRNIVVTDRPNYRNNCKFCMSCINVCPNNAINVKGQKSRKRFVNKNVTVRELIKANNQTR